MDMELPKLKNPEKYVDLYVVDFGDYCSVGFVAEEVAELLESEKFGHCKVYKIHRAYPDGKLELKGVPNEMFQLEAGMFFYSGDRAVAEDDYKRLTAMAVTALPPCRAKVHLAKYSDDKFVVALIYPAEYDSQVSRWLLDGDYRTAGAAEGGTGAVERYYQQAPEIIERHQLFARSDAEIRTGKELLEMIKVAVQR